MLSQKIYRKSLTNRENRLSDLVKQIFYEACLLIWFCIFLLP